MEEKLKVLKLSHLLLISILFLNYKLVSCQKVNFIQGLGYIQNLDYIQGKVEYIDSSSASMFPSHYGGSRYHLILIKDTNNCKYIARLSHDFAYKIRTGESYSFMLKIEIMEPRSGLDSLFSIPSPSNPICGVFTLREDYTKIYIINDIR